MCSSDWKKNGNVLPSPVSPACKEWPRDRTRRHPGTGGKRGEGPHPGAVADLGVAGDGLLHDGVLPHDAIDEADVGTDLAAPLDDRAALQDGARIQADVGLELHRGV